VNIDIYQAEYTASELNLLELIILNFLQFYDNNKLIPFRCKLQPF